MGIVRKGPSNTSRLRIIQWINYKQTPAQHGLNNPGLRGLYILKFKLTQITIFHLYLGNVLEKKTQEAPAFVILI